MTNEAATHNLGFIVEGDGEYHSFKSLVAKIIDRQPGHIPMINAGGFGGVLKKEKLHENLTDLAKLYKVKKIIVCIDLIDPLNEGLCSSCVELKSIIDRNIESWTTNALSDIRIKFVPEVILVIQIQKFESWMIADVNSLIENDIFLEVDQLTDVDELKNPSKFIKDYSKVEFNSKNPMFVKTIISKLDPSIMRKNSKSFDKLAREIKLVFS